ncbi:hypothetical protein TRVL_10212 [Trypanosoma vivax]|nr:hypothetical protein TRVL_10212 [Trypanosoma vivax]
MNNFVKWRKNKLPSTNEICLMKLSPLRLLRPSFLAGTEQPQFHWPHNKVITTEEQRSRPALTYKQSRSSATATSASKSLSGTEISFECKTKVFSPSLFGYR